MCRLDITISVSFHPNFAKKIRLERLDPNNHPFIRFGRLFWLLTGFLCLPLMVHSQFEHKLFTPNLEIEGKLHYGFIYAQHLELEVLNAHFPAFELIIQKMTYGRHKWERDYNYPLIGVSMFYSGAGYNPSLGSLYGVMPFVNFPIFKDKQWTVGFRIALGLGYVTYPFDRLSNYKNLAIGSHFNAAVNLMGDLRYKINEIVTISGGVSIQHFSNGSLKLPNYGVNLPLVNLGVAYRPFKENKYIDDRFYAPIEPYSAIIRRHFDVNIGAYLGYKNMTAVYGQNYVVTHGYATGFLPVSPKSQFGLGIDISYDPSHITTLEKQGMDVGNKFSIIRPGINGAYQLTMSRLGLIANLGIYLAGKETSNGPLYQKFSAQYSFAENFYASIMLKVHWGRADYIGWGVGYKFKVLYGKRTVR